MIGQIPPHLVLAVTHPLDENRAADSGIALVDGLDGDAGNAVAQRLRTQSGLPWCCSE